ncbi:MAG: cache domain-containing protein [Candidatus Auribacterota bacterium]|nr:cache domain-containing protein [Candidatus Auribacterota bacterium]
MRCKFVIGITVAGIAMAIIMSVSGLVIAGDDQEAKVKALVEKGVRMAVADGEEQTLIAIGDPQGPFIEGDLYLFAGPLDMIGLSAHPYRPGLVGRDLSNFKDSKMFSFIADFTRIANEDGAGWVEYMWPKPGEEETSIKRTYIMKVPGKNLYIGCGYYPKPAKE